MTTTNDTIVTRIVERLAADDGITLAEFAEMRDNLNSDNDFDRLDAEAMSEYYGIHPKDEAMLNAIHAGLANYEDALFARLRDFMNV